MSGVNMDKENSDSKENEYPTPKFPKSKSQPQLDATPSSANHGALKPKNIREMSVWGKDVPSSISELQQRPLKNASPLRPLNSPKSRSYKQRKSVLPPTKLRFDHCSDSEESPAWVKQTRGCRRSLSMPTESNSYESENVPQYANAKRVKLFSDETSPYADLIGDENQNPKASSSSTLTPAVKKLFMNKSPSDSVLDCNKIKSAVERIGNNPHLIGDGSKDYILPIIKNGKHPDLKEISCETLAQLLELQSGSEGISFKIIDCRYPYEFEGGHIKGAVNLYTKRQITNELLDSQTILPSPSIRNNNRGIESREVLIFHCEFSSRRGPDCCRYLRACDRLQNQSTYPFLFYPELYVLHGGYKEFFSKFPSLCDPKAYVPMDHPDHSEKYRRFKSESKLAM